MCVAMDRVVVLVDVFSVWHNFPPIQHGHGACVKCAEECDLRIRASVMIKVFKRQERAIYSAYSDGG